MKKYLFSIILLSLQLFASVYQESPSITSRINPSYSKHEVFSFYSSIKEARQGVVNISTKKHTTMNQSPLMQDPLFRQFFGPRFHQQRPQKQLTQSLGSGVIISKSGYIVTNNHVVDGAEEIHVTLPGAKKSYDAKLIGTDPQSDLAVIKIKADNLKPLTIADSNRLKVGDIVFAIGNPFGIGETVTQGIVSALGRNGVGINEYENFIQTDASINPGNSGGALIDSRGFLVGINSAIISRGGGNNGVGFAIPSAMLKHVVSALIEDGSVKRGRLGVGIENISEELYDFYNRRDGAVVTQVIEGSAAQKAGIRLGDLIIKVNDKSVKGASELKNIIGDMTPDQKIELLVLRDKQQKVLTAQLQSIEKSEAAITLLGLKLQELTPKMRQSYAIPANIKGIVIQNVKANSPSYKSGLARGDIIVQLESVPVQTIAQFKQALKRYKKLDKKRLYIYRNGFNRLAVIH